MKITTKAVAANRAISRQERPLPMAAGVLGDETSNFVGIS